MTILPAIDLLQGKCVRLRKGEYSSAQVYCEDPVETARAFEQAGAHWIHVVDLDAARAGSGLPDSGARSNREVLRSIRKAVSCRLQVGGGIRREQDVRALLEEGMDRLVLGTILVRDPDRVASWRARFSTGVLLAGIDAQAGRVKVSGWEGDSELEDLELARRAALLGLAGIVYTSIDRDGTLEGPDLRRTNRVAEASGLPVILSGGIGSPQDVSKVFRQRHPGVQGVIVGKALYEGRVDLASLLRDYPDPSSRPFPQP